MKYIGAHLQSLYSRWCEKRRLAKFPPQFAQDIGILAGSLRAGTSVLQALESVAEQSQPPVHSEWEHVLHDVSLGKNLNDALALLEERIPLPAVSNFVIAIGITQKSGGNVTDILTTISQQITQEILFQGRLSSMTAQGRLTGYIAGAMPFILSGVLSILAPELMAPLFATGIGLFLLGISLILVVTGVLVIKRMGTIEV